MAIRDTQTNSVEILEHQNQSHQITALTANWSEDSCQIAMAENDFKDKSKLFFTIYDVHEDGEMKPVAKRIQIKLPHQKQDGSSLNEEE